MNYLSWKNQTGKNKFNPLDYLNMTYFKEYKRNQLHVIGGILLIIVAIELSKTDVYTFIKQLVVDMGGGITLAVIVAMGLIGLCLLSGVFLVRNT